MEDDALHIYCCTFWTDMNLNYGFQVVFSIVLVRVIELPQCVRMIPSLKQKSSHLKIESPRRKKKKFPTSLLLVAMFQGGFCSLKPRNQWCRVSRKTRWTLSGSWKTFWSSDFVDFSRRLAWDFPLEKSFFLISPLGKYRICGPLICFFRMFKVIFSLDKW